MLKNYAEIIVNQLFDSVFESQAKVNPDLCNCPRCREDVMAIALNRLKPRYVARDEGEIYTKVSYDQVGGKAEVVAALMHGFGLVSRNPRHKKDIG